MEILHARCAGIDVHKKNVKVCLIITQENGKQKKEIRTYSTMTPQLLELHDWLKEQGCSHIAFEATGVYWKRHHPDSWFFRTSRAKLYHKEERLLLNALTRSLLQKCIFQDSFSSTQSAEEPAIVV